MTTLRSSRGAINSPGPDAPSKNITITDCTFENGHGLSIGSEIAGGAQNIHAERIHFKGTDQGIRIKANRDRGNDVSNITFKDIDMVDVKTAILISEYYPKVLPEGDVAAAPVTRLTPHFHEISIENVTATGGAMAGGDCGSAGVAGGRVDAEERAYYGEDGDGDWLCGYDGEGHDTWRPDEGEDVQAGARRRR